MKHGRKKGETVKSKSKQKKGSGRKADKTKQRKREIVRIEWGLVKNKEEEEEEALNVKRQYNFFKKMRASTKTISTIAIHK